MSHNWERGGRGGGVIAAVLHLCGGGAHLDGDVALGYLPHVKPDRRDHVFVELTTLQEGRGRGGDGVGWGGRDRVGPQRACICTQ